MEPRFDLTGQRFGKLTVKIYSDHVTTQGKRMWLCECDCGNTVYALAGNLRKGNNKSCGCTPKRVPGDTEYQPRKISKRYPQDSDAPYRTLMSVYKNVGKTRGYSWDLTLEQFKQFIQQNCYYCGASPANVYKYDVKNTADIFYNGVDRVDNTQGYSPENCVSCCKKCNRSKSNYTVDEFESWILRAAEHIKYGRETYGTEL